MFKDLKTAKYSLPPDLVCVSHLRWGFVYQRPQHLLSRFAKHQRVFFVEEPIPTDGIPRMEVRKCAESGVTICVPQLPAGMSGDSQTAQKLLLNNLLYANDVNEFVLWYYTPMALPFTRHLKPQLTVFDCMDELSAFKGAPQDMKDREVELMRCADLVFTGGHSLFEAKVGRHDDLHCFPSSVEVAHFAQARSSHPDPQDQASIPHPRIGFCGVIDERLDVELLNAVAALKPEWSFVMIGPVVKIDPANLPSRPNIYYLGAKSYKELPVYMAGWEAAMLPFAHNESTRFISPTKTPEYLAAGKPVVSTSIADVVRPYGIQKLVRIADSPRDFVSAIEGLLENDTHDPMWLRRVDATLAQSSWDATWEKMARLMSKTLMPKVAPARELAGVSTTLGKTLQGALGD